MGRSLPLKRHFATHRAPKRRGTPCCGRGLDCQQGHIGKPQDWSGGRSEGKAWKRAFVVVSEGKTRQGSASKLMIG